FCSRLRVVGEFHGIGRPEYDSLAARNFFESGPVVKAERIQPVLLLLTESERERAISQTNRRTVIRERFDTGGKSNVRGSMHDLPMLVAIDRAGDQQVAPGVNILQQRLPC